MTANIDKNANLSPENKKSESDADIIKKSKDTLRYLRSEVQNRVSAEVKNANESLAKALQSLDKWLSWEKEKTRKEIHDDLDVLYKELVHDSSSTQPMDRQPVIHNEIIKTADFMQNHILHEASKDPDPIASAIGKLMQFILQTEK